MPICAGAGSCGQGEQVGRVAPGIEMLFNQSPRPAAVPFIIPFHGSDGFNGLLKVSESNQPHIWDRFFRCDHSRSQPGFGLGLSFARAVALAHAGTLDVWSRPGEGSVFTVTLPV